MKKNSLFVYVFFLISFLFFTCTSLDSESAGNNGVIARPLNKSITIQVLSGSIEIVFSDTDIGEQSIKAVKKELPSTNKKNVFLNEANNQYKYLLLGNHNVVFGVTTIDSEATFSITFGKETTTYTVKNTDPLGKSIYFQNH